MRYIGFNIVDDEGLYFGNGGKVVNRSYDEM